VIRAKGRSKRHTPEESVDWLNSQMKRVGISSLEDLSKKSGIDRGTLSRYFRQERRPSVDVVAPLCEALEVSPETLLIAIGAIDRKR
jgi:transcriptional regulator with XRE-family HTH domain